MKEQLIEFETAKLAKEKGFIIHTMFYYNSDNPLSDNIELKQRGWTSFEAIGMEYSNIDEESGLLTYLLDPINNAPTQSLLQKWLREKHDIHISLNCGLQDYSCIISGYDNRDDSNKCIELEHWMPYEQALEEGLQEALKLI